jgi:hypothetical protein
VGGHTFSLKALVAPGSRKEHRSPKKPFVMLYGVVVSKEGVDVGRKGSGGAWGSTSRNARLAGPSPQNGRIRTLAEKKAEMSVVGLQFGGAENDLLAIRLQSSNTLFSAPPVRAIRGA